MKVSGSNIVLNPIEYSLKNNNHEINCVNTHLGHLYGLVQQPT